MSPSDLIAVLLLLTAAPAGAALALSRSGRPLSGLEAVTEACMRLALGGILIIFAIFLRDREAGLVALVPVLLLAVDFGWDLAIPDLEDQDD